MVRAIGRALRQPEGKMESKGSLTVFQIRIEFKEDTEEPKAEAVTVNGRKAYLGKEHLRKEEKNRMGWDGGHASDPASYMGSTKQSFLNHHIILKQHRRKIKA
jgi:hypothetical protein